MDNEGHLYLLLQEITDHHKDNSAVHISERVFSPHIRLTCTSWGSLVAPLESAFSDDNKGVCAIDYVHGVHILHLIAGCMHASLQKQQRNRLLNNILILSELLQRSSYPRTEGIWCSSQQFGFCVQCCCLCERTSIGRV